MLYSTLRLSVVCLFLVPSVVLAAEPRPGDVVKGEILDPADYGEGVIESMAEVEARAAAATPTSPPKKDTSGEWRIPTPRTTSYPKSGIHHVVNTWGDTRMAIGFGEVVDLQGAYFGGMHSRKIQTSGIRAIGYRDGVEVGRTPWFRQIDREAVWFNMDLDAVDRVVIESIPVMETGGFYAMDDLTFTTGDGVEKVIDFEDTRYKQILTSDGPGYGGLIWERGNGKFEVPDVIPAPAPVDLDDDLLQPVPPAAGVPTAAGDNEGTLPDLELSFRGIIRGDNGQFSIPPDPHGSIGPDHYVTVLNRVFAVYSKETGARLLSQSLNQFLPGSAGDPRVLFDQFSQRWIVIVTDFSTRLFLAVSRTDDPLGSWFKTNFVASQGVDAGRFPDYPTFGVDSNGIYAAAAMFGATMDSTIFVIDKAPLIADNPSLGTVTAFRGLPDGIIQPVHTYGTPPGQYFVSRRNGTSLRVRRVDPPMTNPSLLSIGNLPVASNSAPSDAPALGSNTPLDTVGTRMMNAVYRNGSIWACHTINAGGRSAARWYQFSVSPLFVEQFGTVASPTMWYFFPSIMINAAGDAVMAFSASNPDMFAAAFYTGRSNSDPPGVMAEPQLLRAGDAPYNLLDNFGRNRWGDYSYTSLDPVDQDTIWTIQEFTEANNTWGTWIASFTFGDCNGNDIPDVCELDCGPAGGECDIPGCGTLGDCNSNLRPDVCDVIDGVSFDFNSDGRPDECVNPLDIDGDDDIDLVEFGAFAECAAPASPNESGESCDVFDLNEDDSFDLIDFGLFQLAHTGECSVSFSVDPMDVGVCPGEDAMLTALASGPDLTYQWVRDGVPIVGAISESLTIPFDELGDNTEYSVYAYNRCTVQLSEPANVTTLVPPTIFNDPVDASGCLGENVLFDVQPLGQPPFEYQWSLDGEPIEGATSQVLQINGIEVEDGGVYTATITDASGCSVVSQPALLAILNPLAIISQPVGADVCVGDSVTLFISATGVESFQWLKNGEEIPGATDFFFVIGAATLDDAGDYSVRLADGCDGTFESETALVTVSACDP